MPVTQSKNNNRSNIVTIILRVFLVPQGQPEPSCESFVPLSSVDKMCGATTGRCSDDAFPYCLAGLCVADKASQDMQATDRYDKNPTEICAKTGELHRPL